VQRQRQRHPRGWPARPRRRDGHARLLRSLGETPRGGLGTGLTYQWRRNGINVTNLVNRYAGARTSELTISNLTKPDTLDVYDCAVTSSCTGFTVVSGAGRVTNLLPDLNSDGFINTADLTTFLGRFGTTVSPLNPADLNSDGVLNTADLVGFLGAFGRPCP
jgi:hypothetical protein